MWRRRGQVASGAPSKASPNAFPHATPQLGGTIAAVTPSGTKGIAVLENIWHCELFNRRSDNAVELSEIVQATGFLVVGLIASLVAARKLVGRRP